MVIYDPEKLRAAIQRSYQLPHRQVDRIVDHLDQIDDLLQPVLDAWIEDGTLLPFQVEGIDCEYIMKKLRTHFMDSLIHMSEFLKDRDKAAQFKKSMIVFKD